MSEKRHILIVEDEEDEAEGLRDLWSSDYCITTAYSGEDALRKLEQNAEDFHIVLCDQRMDYLRGDEVLTIITERYPWIQNILMTGSEGRAGLADAVNRANLVGFLAKPFSRDDLGTLLQKAEKNLVKHSDEEKDELTALLNRSSFVKKASRIIKRAHEQKQSVTFALMDLDKFKNINEFIGYVMGDAFLKAFGAKLRKLRVTDLYGRWGGDEFVSLLVGTSGEEAMAFTNRLREEVSQADFLELLLLETAAEKTTLAAQLIYSVPWLDLRTALKGSELEKKVTTARSVEALRNLLDELPPSDGKALIEKTLAEVDFDASKKSGFSCSIGVTEMIPGDDLNAMFYRAEAGLKEAKQVRGRNIVCKS